MLMAIAAPLLRAAPAPQTTLTNRARAPLLDAFDADRRPFAIVFDPFRVVAASGVPPLFTFTARPDQGRRSGPVPLLFDARFALPAGDYEAEVHASAASVLSLRVAREGPPLVSWPVEAGVSRKPFHLDMDLNFVGFETADKESAGAFREVRIRPVSVTNAHQRPVWREVLGTLAAGPATLFLHDRTAWMEAGGFWTRGESTTLLTMASKGEAQLPLRVHCGALRNTVRLSTIGWEADRTLAPGEHADIAVPSAPDTRTTLLRIDTAAGFVPASVEPGSRDRRFLGCRFEVAGTVP
jgi:hypothetical protein